MSVDVFYQAEDLKAFWKDRSFWNPNGAERGSLWVDALVLAIDGEMPRKRVTIEDLASGSKVRVVSGIIDFSGEVPLPPDHLLRSMDDPSLDTAFKTWLQKTGRAARAFDVPVKQQSEQAEDSLSFA